MEFSDRPLSVSTPGRICLFGEHQDYLQLPVIAAGISLRITIEGTKRVDRKVNIDLPDIRRRESFEITDPLSYTKKRDYFRSAINVLGRRHFHFQYGFDCAVHSDIPINAGTASSSALVVGWVNFLSRMCDQPRDLSPEEIARMAHEAEVSEFGEPGGIMDHYSTAKGGVIWLESHPEPRMVGIEADLKSFVLGNSHHPKDTTMILANVKDRILEVAGIVGERHPEFSLHTASREDLERFCADLDPRQFDLLAGTVRNREISCEARELITHAPLDHKRIGELLNEHQTVLRDVLKISTPKIDRMIEVALNAGAYGAKINGSGGGGCMFAYAPENPEAVAEAVRSVSEATVVHVDCGTREEKEINV